MATMKAILVEETGGVDKLIYKDIPIPQPKDGTVVIKNHFIGMKENNFVKKKCFLVQNQVLCMLTVNNYQKKKIGVNYIDTYHRTGLYTLPLPFVLGRER